MSVVTRILSALFVLVGAATLCAAIWIGLPILGNDLLASSDVRAALIGAALLILLLVFLLRRRARRRAAKALERSLVAGQVGDGEVLAERMQDAVAQLKQAGGATALYDLPWYVLIGPPGAGKTTALVHSGLEFPSTDPGSVAGFGGTRNCDFWFAKDAVLVDTAGRYTTQDSDAAADKASWSAFLEQLKGARPDQPINGVILALSCADLMTAGDSVLRTHADTIRARLSEVHAALRTHVPVYVIFTKADMIAGFRQYFGPFDEGRRRGVWGVTFQTRSRKEDTWRAASGEFAQLVTRLSDEVTDRMVEELDSATRIAIFGFPSQMAMLEPKITNFLQNVFEGAADTKAILRGFYFTSGTQEGTPIDQVLGSIASSGAGGLQPSFMSGRGRSYFLHDLLKKVIFAERDWVGYDRRRALRRALFRGFGKTVIAAVCLGVVGLFGYSFWQNASLVREADAQTRAYATRAATLLNTRYVANAATRPLLPALASARAIPTGYGDPRPQTRFEQFGLSRRDTLRSAAIDAYSESLEQLLRPRMMLLAERRLAGALEIEDWPEAYRTLKVYILVAKEQDGPDDDLAIQSYFADAWINEYAISGSDAEYRAINAHLSAMLALDDRVSPPIKPNKTLVDRARQAMADVPLAVEVFSAIRSEAGVLPPWRLVDAMGAGADALRVADGRARETLGVPGLYTFEGYWSAFQQALAAAEAYAEADAWVLARAPASGAARAALPGEVHALYAARFAAEWAAMLDRVSGKSGLDVVVPMVEAVVEQTRLTRVLDPDPASGGDSKTLINIKNISPDLTNGELRRRSEAVQRAFDPWLSLAQGPQGARPVDGLVRDLQGLGADPDVWPGVARLAPSLPPVLGRIAGEAGLVGARAALARDVTAVCVARIAPYRPFAGPGAEPLSLADFAAFFGYGGQVDRFWQSYPGQAGVTLPVSSGVRDLFAEFDGVRARLFPPGSAVPDVALTLRLGGVTAGVVSVDVDLGDGNQRLVSGGPGIVVRWPSDVQRMVWTVNASTDTATTAEVEGGPWAVPILVQTSEDVQTEADSVQVTRRAGAYAFRVILAAQSGAEVPFIAPIWRDFTCPRGLE